MAEPRMGDTKREVLLAILGCKEKGMIEQNVLSTARLTKVLNSNESKSREWDPFGVGYIMAELGFDMSVTPVAHLRGWLIADERLSTLLHSVTE